MFTFHAFSYKIFCLSIYSLLFFFFENIDSSFCCFFLLKKGGWEGCCVFFFHKNTENICSVFFYIFYSIIFSLIRCLFVCLFVCLYKMIYRFIFFYIHTHILFYLYYISSWLKIKLGAIKQNHLLEKMKITFPILTNYVYLLKMASFLLLSPMFLALVCVPFPLPMA